MRVVITNMKASRVNLHQNHFASGLPPVTAFMGLSACIMHELGFDRHAVRVIPIIHDLYISQGRTRSEMGKKESHWAPQEIPEDMHGTVFFSMILDLPADRDIQDIEACLIGKRLAGGVIFPAVEGKPILIREVAKNGNCFRSLMRGRIIVPLKDMPISFGDAGTIWPVTDAYLYNPDVAEGVISVKGWRVPLAIGYRLIGEINEVPPHGGRDKVTPHTFAEPGVSVAELVSIRNPKITTADNSTIDDLFFAWSSAGHHITVHQHYNPSLKG